MLDNNIEDLLGSINAGINNIYSAMMGTPHQRSESKSTISESDQVSVTIKSLMGAFGTLGNPKTISSINSLSDSIEKLSRVSKEGKETLDSYIKFIKDLNSAIQNPSKKQKTSTRVLHSIIGGPKSEELNEGPSGKYPTNRHGTVTVEEATSIDISVITSRLDDIIKLLKDGKGYSKIESLLEQTLSEIMRIEPGIASSIESSVGKISMGSVDMSAVENLNNTMLAFSTSQNTQSSAMNEIRKILEGMDDYARTQSGKKGFTSSRLFGSSSYDHSNMVVSSMDHMKAMQEYAMMPGKFDSANNIFTMISGGLQDMMSVAFKESKLRFIEKLFAVTLQYGTEFGKLQAQYPDAFKPIGSMASVLQALGRFRLGGTFAMNLLSTRAIKSIKTLLTTVFTVIEKFSHVDEKAFMQAQMVITSISSLMDELSKSLKTMVKTVALLGVISHLTSPKDMWAAVAIIGALSGITIAVSSLLAMTGLIPKTNMAEAGTAFKNISDGIMMLTATAVVVSIASNYIDESDLWRGVGVVLTMVAGIAIISGTLEWGLSGLIKDGDAGQMNKIMESVTSIATAVAILTGTAIAISSLAMLGLDMGKMWTALGFLGLMVAGLGSILLSVAWLGRNLNMKEATGDLTDVAKSIMLLEGVAVAAIGLSVAYEWYNEKYPDNNILSGNMMIFLGTTILGMSALMVGLGFANRNGMVDKGTDVFRSLSTSMLLMTASLGLIAIIAVQYSKYHDDINRGLGTMALIVGSITAMTLIVAAVEKKNGFSIKSAVASMALLSAAVFGLGFATHYMAKKASEISQMEGVWDGLGVMGVITGVIGATVITLGLLLTGPQAILLPAVGLALVGLGALIGVLIGVGKAVSHIITALRMQNEYVSEGGDFVKDSASLGAGLNSFIRGVTSGIDLSIKDVIVMNKLAKSLTGKRGFVGAVSSLMELVVNMNSMRVPIYGDSSDPEKITGYKQLDAAMFTSGAATLGESLGNFIKNLSDKLASVTESRKHVTRMKRISKTLLGKNGFIPAVSQLLDIIATLGDGDLSMISYDEYGNIIKGPSRDNKPNIQVNALAQKGAILGSALGSFISKTADGINTSITDRKTASIFKRVRKELTGDKGYLVALSQFLEIINQIGNMRIIDKIDENGNITYKTLDLLGETVEAGTSSVLFSKAATAVAGGMGIFITTLATKLQDIGALDRERMRSIASTLMGTKHTPGLLPAISNYMDIIYKFSEGTYIASIDPVTGKATYAEGNRMVMSLSAARDSAAKISGSFGTFIHEIVKSFHGVSLAHATRLGDISHVMVGTAKNPGILTVITEYVKMIDNISNGMIAETDASGNTVYKYANAERWSSGAELLISNFEGFIKPIADGFSKIALDAQTKTAIKGINKTLLGSDGKLWGLYGKDEGLLKTLNHYMMVMSILTQQRYITGWDSNGLPTTSERLTISKDIDGAKLAEELTNMTKFVLDFSNTVSKSEEDLGNLPGVNKGKLKITTVISSIDKAVLNNAKKRNEALSEFTDKINELTESLRKLAEVTESANININTPSGSGNEGYQSDAMPMKSGKSSDARSQSNRGSSIADQIKLADETIAKLTNMVNAAVNKSSKRPVTVDLDGNIHEGQIHIM